MKLKREAPQRLLVRFKFAANIGILIISMTCWFLMSLHGDPLGGRLDASSPLTPAAGERSAGESYSWFSRGLDVILVISMQ